MAKITINEISQNYTFNIGDSSYAIVALPITACWGPGFDHTQVISCDPEQGEPGYQFTEEDLENTKWLHFPATQAGMEEFVRTFRGPSSNYRLCQDFSYQQALTYLSAGYDVLVCRVGSSFARAASVTVDIVSPASQSALVSDAAKNACAPFKTTSISTAQLTFVGHGTTAPTEVTGRQAGDLYLQDPVAPANGAVYVVDVTSSTVDTLLWRSVGTVYASAISASAKYKGTFGNSLSIAAKFGAIYSQPSGGSYPADMCNLIVTVTDTSGVSTAVENLSFWLPSATVTDDSLPRLEDLDSQFLVGVNVKDVGISVPRIGTVGYNAISAGLSNGSDNIRSLLAEPEDCINLVKQMIKQRFDVPLSEEPLPNTMAGVYTAACMPIGFDGASQKFSAITMREVVFLDAIQVYDLLKDTLSYPPNRLVSPGWDDYDLLYLDDSSYADLPATSQNFSDVTPLHKKLMEVAYYSRCATAYIDVPRSLLRKYVYSPEGSEWIGYAQRLSQYRPSNVSGDINGVLFNTHSGLFTPWGQYMYVSTSKYNVANPAFEALLIERAMILNQAAQYEWALPSNRQQNVKIGKLDYTVSKKLLDTWQGLSGVGVNVITNIPDMGVSLWGNSTLFDVPPATYQALSNLSTRKLFNAVEDVVYKCGISITFSYNNAQAYSKFYVGVTPLLDMMKNVGAIDGYYVKVAGDINSLDQVNANSVVGKIYLVINGVINDVTVDLIAMPAGTDLSQFAQ